MAGEARPIRRLLVANRGEIARRVMRTARAMGIGTVAVHSEPDADAPFVREADVAVALGGAAPGESYLRIDAVLDAARRAGADAVHPGYGFLAENAAFARAVLDAGLVWVGPSPEAIEAMGSKLEAKRRMAEAGVPVLPSADVTGVSDDDAIRAAAGEVGFPLLAKASAGGGGKGMRIVRSADEVVDAVAAARREAAGAFGDDALFLERLVEGGRHVEIQVLGDTHGTVVSLGERECSIQRRHQKVLEEAPSPVVDDALRARMGEAAVAAGEALGYVGAGTVEFLLEDSGAFWFLEVNTRLQVEHPVTEAVTGLDLVRLQLLVAEGAPLPPEAVTPARTGHAIEVRLYAEDPAAGYVPQTGTLARFRVPSEDGLRVDTGVEDGSEISVHYDPMVAKVVAHAPTRAEAARRLAAALRRAEVHGLVTNRDLLVRVLEHPAYLAGATDTSFLDRHAGDVLRPLLDDAAVRAGAAAAALAGQAARRAAAPVQTRVPSGWRNLPSADQEVVFDGPGGAALAVGYRFTRGRLDRLAVDGEPLADAALGGCAPAEVQLAVGGVRRTYGVHAAGDGRVWVNGPSGQLDLVERPRFTDPAAQEAAGSLRSPMPGAVLRVAVEPGAQVERGAVLLVIEAMKMEHEIAAPATGVVSEVRVAAGEQVEAGAVLAVIDEG